MQRHWFFSGLSVGLFVILWWIFSLRHPSFLVPAISETLERGWDYLEAGTLWADLWQTMSTALIGFLVTSILGLFVGIIAAKSLAAKRLLWPYVLGLQSIPIVAILPLLVLWFDNGQSTQILLIVLMSSFPVILGVYQALVNMSPNWHQLFRTYQARADQVFFQLELPLIWPHLMSALRVTLSLALIATIISELYLQTGGEGLGYRLVDAKQNRFDTPLAFAVLGVLIFLGLSLQLGLRFAGKLIYHLAYARRSLGMAG